MIVSLKGAYLEELVTRNLKNKISPAWRPFEMTIEKWSFGMTSFYYRHKGTEAQRKGTVRMVRSHGAKSKIGF